jgi:hypothetical protein
MPYITEERRKAINLGEFPQTAGELNYTITDLVDAYIQHHQGLTYSVVNEVIGALECAKLELYRRVAAPYEDEKIKQNGDVYSCAGISQAR